MDDTREWKKRILIVNFSSETLPKIDSKKRVTEQQLSTIKSNANVRTPSRKSTSNKTSILRHRSSLKPRVKQSIDSDHNDHRSNQKQLSTTHKTKGNLTLSQENKSSTGLEILQSQTSVMDQNEILSGTITSDFGGTIGSQRDTMNDTITSEFGTIDSNRSLTNRIRVYKNASQTKIDVESQETLDLLTKIRHSANAVPIGPMPLSQQSCRFELPFDLKLLETLTPLDYLSKYCRLSPRRQYQFKRMFDRYRNRQYQFESSSLYSSIVDIHKENFTGPKFDYLCKLIDLGQEERKFTFDTYAGILAVCERILYNSSTLHHGYEDGYLTKDAIEKCDFYSLERKLDGLQISDTMKRLLRAL